MNYKLKQKLKAWVLDQMLKESGIDMSPDPVWGVLNKAEEDIVLARLYDDKMFLSLMRKYAEIANRKMITKDLMNEPYWKHRGEFFVYNSILIKSKRAKDRLNENRKHNDKGRQQDI